MRRRGRELGRLAREQATLRRVATLVARGAPPADLFTALADEIGRLLPGDRVVMGRSEPDGSLTPVAAWSRSGTGADEPELMRAAAEDLLAQGDRARSGADAGEDVPPSRVGALIRVEGRLWGAVVASLDGKAALPPDADARLTEFAELIATVIANAESRAELAASRARIVAASDEVRRRIERDLHDGAQQRLVSLALEIRAAQAAIPSGLDQVRAELSRVADGITDLLDELRTVAHGIHPAILDTGGLGPALKTLARRSPVPVQLDLRTGARLPERAEVAAYYVVSETLTNVAKHGRATVVRVAVESDERRLRISIHDDGVGGADPSRGSGLVGLKDRVEALNGSFTLSSPPGEGTSIEVELPLRSPPA